MKKILITILLIVPIVSFAALNFDTTTDTVNHGSATNLDDLSAFTWAMWVKPRAGVGNDSIILKNGAFPTGKLVIVPSANDVQLVIGRATVSLNILTSNNFFTYDTWNFLVFTYDAAAGTSGNIYGGSSTQKASLQALDATSVQGSGATNADAASSLVLGNNTTLALGSLPMDILWFGAWNRALTLAEIQSLQFFPRKTSGMLVNAWAGFTGMSTIADWSGSGNTGTISGLVRTFSAPRVKYR